MSAAQGRNRRSPRRVPTSNAPLKAPARTPLAPIKDTHKWADYVELRCLISLDQYVTVSDAAGWFRIDPQDGPDEPDLDDGDITQLQDGDTAGLGGDDHPDVDAAMRVDNRQRLAEDVFRLLVARSASYGDDYPFVVASSGDRLTCHETLTEGQRAYVFFLLCALGRYVSKHQALTGAFERACAVALKNMIPTAEVHIFGTAGEGAGRYDGGTFKSKVKRLAADLGEVEGPHVSRISDTETADRGLDVVGWVSIGDGLPSRLVVFCQAACTDEWETKQDSPSSDAWDQIVMVTSPPVVACCIPHCFRDANGDWHDQTKIHRRLLLDRHRMLHLLSQPNGALPAGVIADAGVTDEVLAYRLPA